MVGRILAALFVVGCATVEGPDAAKPTDAVLRADGDPCADASQCDSGVCVPVLPEQAEERGVCWGPGMSTCVNVVGFERWSEDVCRGYGMTDVICPPVRTDAMNERCIVPAEPPTGEAPFAYVCCEATYFE
jgi:hypothetical protein